MSEDVGVDSLSPARDGENNRPPPRIPDHTILRKIGAGKYGEVWLARNIMGDYRAVKVVYRNSFQEARPFDREFEGLKAFSKAGHHPSQVNIYHVGRNENEGYFYSVMDLADDQVSRERFNPDLYAPRTIRNELDQHGHLPPDECVKIALPLAAALEHLHACNLIHRDIKPANVIFVGGQPKLADIGLVATVDEDCSFVGTEGYVPPEGPGKAQADIYSLGMVLYRMLTGLPISQFPTLPGDWSAKPNRLAQELNLVVAKACEPNPQRRYRTTEELRKELAILDIGDSLRSRRNWEKLQQKFRRYGPWLAVILIAGFASLGTFIFKRRAAGEDHRREMRDLRLVRLDNHEAGWFDRHWLRLVRAAQLRIDDELLEQATAALSAIDTRTTKTGRGVPVTSASFAEDGRILLDGVGDQHAVLIETNGTVIELPAVGQGPVGWTSASEPRQLVAISNSFLLRDPVSGRLVQSFPIDSSVFKSADSRPILALSRDCNLAAGAVGDRLMVYDARTGPLLHEYSIQPTCLVFSPDGLLLAAGRRDGTTCVYSMQHFTEVAALSPPLRGSPILCLAFGHDAVVPYNTAPKTNTWILATGDQSANIVVWDLARHLPRTFCRGSSWSVQALAFPPDSTILASAGQANSFLWDVATGKPLLSINFGGSERPTALAFDQEGRKLIGGCNNDGGGSFKLCEIVDNHGINTLRGLASAARKVWFSRDRKRVAALSDDWRLAIWDFPSGRLLWLFEVPLGDTADSAGGSFSNDGQNFAFATGNEACEYDLSSGKIVSKWGLNAGNCDQLQFDSRGKLILLREERAVGERRFIWRLYSLLPSQLAQLLREQDTTNWFCYAVTLAPHAEKFLVRDKGDGKTKQGIHVFDAASGREIWHALAEFRSTISWNSIDPEGLSFEYYAFGRPGDLRWVSLSDFREIGKLNDGCFALSVAGAQFCSGWLYPDQTRPSYSIHLGMDLHQSYDASAFSPDGRFLAWGTEEGLVLVADIPEVERRLATLR